MTTTLPHHTKSTYNNTTMKKKLSLILAAILAITASAVTPVPRDTSFTLHSTAVKIHKKHPEAQIPLSTMPQGIRQYNDVVYSTITRTPYGKRQLHADIFRPDDNNTYPALIMIHGGGWNSGDKTLQAHMARQIAAQGYVTIPIEYRLIPEALYPAALHDVKTAIRWIRQHASQYGVDPGKIAVSGCSAGAQLATLAGVTNHSPAHEGKGQWRKTPSDVQAIINIDGIATFVSESNIADADARFRRDSILPVNARWLGGLYDQASSNWREASPLLWVTEHSAPICFISSALPRYSDGRDELIATYDSIGIYNEAHRIPVDIHPFWFFHPWVDTTVDRAVRFLNRIFKPQTATIPTKYVITNHGVTQDSTLLQTTAIQAVIDLAETNGGGEIIIPQGTFLTGALFFKPNTTLTLRQGARLKGTTDINQYPLLPSRMEGKNIYYHAALINAYHVDNFEINGPGTIDGNGYTFWTQFWENVSNAEKEQRQWTNLEVRRPRLLFLWGCDKARISGASLINSAFWTSHFYRCDDLIVENCHIEAPSSPVRAPSSDAIDLDGCHRVIIRGCHLNCDDDGVCIKGGKGVYANRSYENDSVTDVLIHGCTFGPNLHGILTIGSECIHADRITLRNCKLDTKCALLRMKMRPDTYQKYHNITVSDVTGKCGTLLEILPWKQFYTLEGSQESPSAEIDNITLSGITLSCDSPGAIAANPADTIGHFTLRNIHLKAKSDTLRCNYPHIRLTDVTVNGKAPIILPADEEMKHKLNFDAADLTKNH